MQVLLENTDAENGNNFLIDPGSVQKESRAPSETFWGNDQEGQALFRPFIFRYNAPVDSAWRFLGGRASNYYKVWL